MMTGSNKKDFNKYKPGFKEYLESEVIRRYGKEGLRILRKHNRGRAIKVADGVIYERMVVELSRDFNSSEIAMVSGKSREAINHIKRKNA